MAYGSVALGRAVEVIDDEKERGELMKAAWRNYSPIAWAGLGALAATTIYWWTQPDRRLNDTELTIAKIRSGLVIGAIASAATSACLGSAIAGQTSDERTPVKSGHGASEATPESARKALKLYPWVTATNLVCGAGIIVCSALLSDHAKSKTKWLW